MALVITRKAGETIWIGNAEVKIVRVKGDEVRLGITAPANVEIWRSELRPNQTFTIPQRHFTGDMPLEY